MPLKPNEPQGRSAPNDNMEPWPLATNAILRVLAWPRYDDTESIKRVLTVAEPLFDNQKGCLCLRHDPSHDIPYEQAVSELEIVFDMMGLQGDLEVLFINEPIEEKDWPRLGKSITAMIQVDAYLDEYRQSFVNALARSDVEIIGVATGTP